jgi:hypothetical protein
MAAFRKFDPYTFLVAVDVDQGREGASSEAAAEASETLATLGTLAGKHPQNENKGSEYELVTGKLEVTHAKAAKFAKAGDEETGTLATTHSENENAKSGPALAKAAKAANSSAACVRGAAEGLGANRSEPPPAKGAKPAKASAANVQRIGDEKRGAIIEHDYGVPRSWAEGFARLHRDRPPGDAPTRRWQTFIDDVGQFLDGGWAKKAAAIGWGSLDLFGADRERPFARIDCAGLLWLLNGDTLVELDRHRAVIERRTGAQQTYRRRPVAVGDVMLAWKLADGVAPTTPRPG